jgi:hypothetical protein
MSFRNLIKYGLVFALGIGSKSVLAEQKCEDFSEQLSYFRTSNPILEAEKTIASGKLKLLGIYGYALSIPGVDEKKEYCYLETLSVEGIKGTTDFVRCQSQMELNLLATIYAEKFNQKIEQHLIAKRFHCPSNLLLNIN